MGKEENKTGNNTLSQNNPNYQAFNDIDQDIADIVNTRSVINQNVEKQNERYANPSWQTFFDTELLAMPLATNKPDRLNMYRRIAKYLICDWCLDEICDDFIHEDENNEFIKLKLPDRLSSKQQDILQNEFKKYIDLFDLRDNGYSVIKRFLIEGELCWENVIKTKHPELGIIGVKLLPAEYYETLVDTKSGRPVGVVFDTEKFSKDTRDSFTNSFTSAAQVFNSISPYSYNFQFNKQTSIPLLWNQVTYINSGEYSYDNLISYPLIEKARQQYQRLALIEDSAVILRVTHAPERLLFNISTGKMNQNYADEYVRRFANELKSKKVSTPDGKDVIGVYNPVTMLKSYVFGKSDGNEGTTVSSVGKTVSYSEMEDIEYFVRWFLKALKVPFARYKTPENVLEKNDQMSSEEYTFSRMIIRFQRRFAGGFKKGYITHLKLRGLWDKKDYELLENEIKIEFVKPVLYDLYETQKLVDIKTSIYKAFKDNDEISKIVVMKKFLGYSDKDIEENFNMLIKEKQLIAIADYFAELITPENPPVGFKSPIKLKSDVAAEQAINTMSNLGNDGNAEDAPTDDGQSGQNPEEPNTAQNEEQPEENASSEEPTPPDFGLN